MLPLDLLEQLIDDRAVLHDVTAAILMFQNNETAAMLVIQTNRLGVEIVGATFSKFDCVIMKKSHLKSNELIDIL